ncbi:hypothetical protein EDB87DRAFT_829796 [Lactarius vividus]|nr:hypothetical protein EDB87DRAFT_829796 [Lactarius vividus]
MSHHAGPATYDYRFSPSETSEKNFQVTPPAIVPVPSHSPLRPYSWDFSPESGSISSTGSSPEILSHTLTGYNCPHRSDDQPLWGCSTAGQRYEARSHPLGYPFDVTFAPPPSIGDARTRPDQRFSRIEVFGVVYTDDARRKLGEGVRRWCFNCRAVETTTWRRSSLSPGKLLCNKCGLFERTHRIPRPETFPRRRRTRPASVLPVPGYPPYSSGEQLQCYNGPPSTIPLTQYLQPFDSVGGQSISQSTPWMTQNELGPSSSPAVGSQCYPTAQQQTMYRGQI